MKYVFKYKISEREITSILGFELLQCKIFYTSDALPYSYHPTNSVERKREKERQSETASRYGRTPVIQSAVSSTAKNALFCV